MSPGGYDPDGSGSNSTFNEAYSRRTAVRRMMNNDDIKGAIIFLASDASTCETLHHPAPHTPSPQVRRGP